MPSKRRASTADVAATSNPVPPNPNERPVVEITTTSPPRPPTYKERTLHAIDEARKAKHKETVHIASIQAAVKRESLSHGSPLRDNWAHRVTNVCHDLADQNLLVRDSHYYTPTPELKRIIANEKRRGGPDTDAEEVYHAVAAKIHSSPPSACATRSPSARPTPRKRRASAAPNDFGIEVDTPRRTKRTRRASTFSTPVPTGRARTATPGSSSKQLMRYTKKELADMHEALVQLADSKVMGQLDRDGEEHVHFDEGEAEKDARIRELEARIAEMQQAQQQQRALHNMGHEPALPSPVPTPAVRKAGLSLGLHQEAQTDGVVFNSDLSSEDIGFGAVQDRFESDDDHAQDVQEDLDAEQDSESEMDGVSTDSVLEGKYPGPGDEVHVNLPKHAVVDQGILVEPEPTDVLEASVQATVGFDDASTQVEAVEVVEAGIQAETMMEEIEVQADMEMTTAEAQTDVAEMVSTAMQTVREEVVDMAMQTEGSIQEIVDEATAPLKENIKDLEAENDTFKFKVMQMDARAKDLQDEVFFLTEARSTHQKIIDSYKVLIQEIGEVVDASPGENVVELVGAIKTDAVAARAMVRRLEGEKDALQGLRNRIVKVMQGGISAMGVQVKGVEGVEGQIGALESALAGMLEKVKSMELERVEAQSKIEAATKKAEEARAMLAEATKLYDANYKALTTKLTGIQAEQLEARETISTLRAQVAKLEDRAQSAELEKTGLEAEVSEMNVLHEQELLRMQEEYEITTHSLKSEMQEKMALLVSDMVTLNHSLSQKEEQSERLKAEFSDEKERYQQKLLEAAEDLSDLKRELANKDQSLAELRTLHEDAVDAHDAEAQMLRDEIVELQSQAVKDSAAYEEKLSNLRIRLERLETGKMELMHRNMELEQSAINERAAHQERIEAQDKEIKIIQAEISATGLQRDADQREHNTKVAGLEAVIAHLKGRENEITETLADREAQLERLLKLKDELVEVNQAAEEELLASRAQVEADLLHSQQLVRKLTYERDALHTTLRQTEESAQEAMEMSQQDLESLNLEWVEKFQVLELTSKEELQSLRTEKSVLEDRLVEATAHVEELRFEIEAVTREYNEAQEVMTALQHHVQEAETKQKQLQDQLSEMQEIDGERNERIAVLDHTIDEKDAQIQQLFEEMRVLVHAADAAEAESANLNLQLNQAFKEQERLRHVNERLVEGRREIVGECEGLRQKLGAMENIVKGAYESVLDVSGEVREGVDAIAAKNLEPVLQRLQDEDVAFNEEEQEDDVFELLASEME
ncbi:hypothetical protein G7K_3435-t1 [Saitoella complicata NRRL Y-17804]|uniref:Uncharacterized protein n=1 Tax=Saitoella complicata (strain BCRC 22490 / CBS 7301 / JCM 7358 / NBRC 10748 / NRRL Y-17804) TaxID=698492 RepID=A0A0E9NHI8_SAICN|nr:hypothetical protein G7K_3435-t1 [Saitoella complicata NRRL Y-17804]